MNILVLGSGLMGPAAVLDVITAPEVAHVTVCDLNQQSLDACISKFAHIRGADKLTAVRLDMHDQAAAVDLFARFDVVIAALPWEATALAIEAALQARRPLVGIARPVYSQMPALKEHVHAAGGLIITGCGLEPGLTEIMAHHLAQQLERVDELHIRCGGIPLKASPPLGYKIVFGGDELPLHDREVYAVKDGKLQLVPRFSDVEQLVFPQVGECEAWFDGLLPWLIELPALQNLRVCTQKTIRWPGFAAKVAVLKEMGLLSQTPINVDGVPVVPKRLVDVVLGPRVKLEEGEHDLVLFRVEARGQCQGQSRRLICEMVDRYDEPTRLTAMARTTSFTAASVARMIGRGELSGRGVLAPEQALTGPLVERLHADLAAMGIVFTMLDGNEQSLLGASADVHPETGS